MKFIVELKPKAEKDLRKIDKHNARRVYNAILSLENGLEGDIKKLTNRFPEYRFRIGNWRVLFEIVQNKSILSKFHGK